MSAKNGQAIAAGERLLSVVEVAARLGVCRRTVERLAASEGMPRPLKIGHLSKYIERDVTRFVEGHRHVFPLVAAGAHDGIGESA